MIGTTSSPRGTASAPPGQKSFWMSTTMSTSLPLIMALSLIGHPLLAAASFGGAIFSCALSCVRRSTSATSTSSSSAISTG